MKFELLLTLKEMAVVKVSATLWNCVDRRRITAYIAKYNNRPFCRVNIERMWMTIEDEIKEKVPKLELPLSLEQKVSHFVKPLGVEILKWSEYHCLGGYLDIDVPNEFCWTSQGTIDLKKTAELLVEDESLCLTTRYKLACIYCLENDVRELWDKMSNSCKAIFYSSEDYIGLVEQQELVTFWTLDIHGTAGPWVIKMNTQRREEHSPYQFAFQFAAIGGNVEATKYFWKKLTPEEKETSLFKTVENVVHKRCDSSRNSSDFPKEFYARVMCFLLSQLKAEQQMEVFRKHARSVMVCLMDWPWHSLFMETVNLIWDYIPARDCHRILLKIVSNVFQGLGYYDYPALFTEFWLQCLPVHKQYIVSHSSVACLIDMLFKAKDVKNSRIILEAMNPVGKKQFFSSLYGQIICYDLIYYEDWGLLELFMRQCIPSKEDMVKFKQNFPTQVALQNAHEQFVSLCDSLIREHDKRKCIEEDYGNSSKKLASTEDEGETCDMEK